MEHRPVEKLKVLWENLKRPTRKHFSIVRAEKFKTGKNVKLRNVFHKCQIPYLLQHDFILKFSTGGGKSGIISTDPIYVRVKKVTEGTCESLQQRYDFDYLPGN